jgi:hypothetical protein
LCETIVFETILCVTIVRVTIVCLCFECVRDGCRVVVGSFLAQKHDWSPAVITDTLQLLQKVTVRARNRTMDEPFALNFKALKVRLELVHGLAGKVGNAKSKPTAMSVSGDRAA